MGLKSDSRTVEGVDGTYEVRVTQFSAPVALRLLSRLGKVLVPALGKLPANASLNTVMANDFSMVAPALTALFANLDGEDASILMRDLLKSSAVIVNDRLIELATESKITEAFGTDLKALLGAMKFSLEVNFRGFFKSTVSASQSSVPSLATVPAQG